MNFGSKVSRRTWLQTCGGSLVAGGWLTPLAETLAKAAEQAPSTCMPRSLIVLWLQGGPSQLETFDPHPGTKIAAGTTAIPTRLPGVQLARGLEQLADLMDRVSLVRSMVSKEGDHERATYYAKTGYRPDPTLVHPAIGAVLCHQLSDQVEIPRHISILPHAWPARGGYLGSTFDAFQIGDPQGPIPDVVRQVPTDRHQQRLADLERIEAEFTRGRRIRGGQPAGQHRAATQAAVRMMSSAQLKAFDVGQEPAAVLAQFGDSAFGRGCLAAARLVSVGVRCVEVTLGGWDSHLDNHETHRQQVAILDPAFAALIRYLEARQQLDQTLILCAGEFGRTPYLNPAGGRDHWPHGFSIALAGGRIAGGRVIGATSPEIPRTTTTPTAHVQDPHTIADLHATVLHALGVNPAIESMTPIGRPLKWSDGQPIAALLS
jgi:hypothetical protein